jgi:hypothetical protein
MKTFVVRKKRAAPAIRRSQPSMFGYAGLRVKDRQTEVRRILGSAGVQAKLTISQPNDEYEQEADRVADQVMAMSDPKHQRQPENGEEEETLQTKPLSDQITPLVQRQEGLSAQVKDLKGGGQPLPQSERSFFEPRLDHNFSQVRVHTDARANAAATSANAKAFTTGSDVVFSTGQYEPGVNRGRKLLAHELTHVIQQKGTTYRHFASEEALQRKLTYHRQIPEAEARKKGYLKEINEAIKALDEKLKKPASTLKSSERLKDVFATLLDLEKSRKITHWETSGANAPASFEPLSGEMRIHYHAETSTHPGGRIKRGRSLKTVFIHEATHALHAKKYPRTFKTYGKALAAGTAEGAGGLELIKFKAFTEYWAYRRQWEYYNLRQNPEFQIDPHKQAMQENDVKRSISRAVKETGEPFDPSKWKPKEKRKK